MFANTLFIISSLCKYQIILSFIFKNILCTIMYAVYIKFCFVFFHTSRGFTYNSTFVKTTNAC